MKFYTIEGDILNDGGAAADYGSARSIGPMKIGSTYAFFKAGLKTFAVAGAELDRVYRRVLLVPARMCCGRGDLAVENIVLEKDGKQIAEIRMPGERAGKAALEEMKKIAPGASFTCPPKNMEDPA